MGFPASLHSAHRAAEVRTLCTCKVVLKRRGGVDTRSPRPKRRVLLSVSPERIRLQQKESLPADRELQVSASVTAVIYRPLDSVGGRWTGQERRQAADKYSASRRCASGGMEPTHIYHAAPPPNPPFGSQLNAKTAKAGIYGWCT